MRVEALKGFCGVLSMAKGEIREYGDEAVLADLISAGYIKEAEEEPKRKGAQIKKKVAKSEDQ
mgnify:CR=1 FL=1